MSTPKFLFMFVLCFYYALLTPKAADYKTQMENYLFEVVFMSLMQGGIVWAGLYYLDLEWTVQSFIGGLIGYSPQTHEIAIFIGVWTLVGGLQWPYVNETLQEEAAEKRRQERSERFRESLRDTLSKANPQNHQSEKAPVNAAVPQSNKSQREKEIDTWDRSVEEKGFEKSLQIMRRHLRNYHNGIKPYGDTSILKDPEWMEKEIRTLETMLEGERTSKAGAKDPSQIEAIRREEIADWHKTLEYNSAEKAIKALERQIRLLDHDQDNGYDLLIMKDRDWMVGEIKRLKSLNQ